jgi:hypothetical protein
MKKTKQQTNGMIKLSSIPKSKLSAKAETIIATKQTIEGKKKRAGNEETAKARVPSNVFFLL